MVPKRAAGTGKSDGQRKGTPKDGCDRMTRDVTGVRLAARRLQQDCRQGEQADVHEARASPTGGRRVQRVRVEIAGGAGQSGRRRGR